MDLFYIFGGIGVFIFALYHWVNWRERCQEFPNYVSHPAPPTAPAAADRRGFTRLWRRFHGSYAAYSLPNPGRKGEVLSLGAYIRARELGQVGEPSAFAGRDRN